MKTIYTTISATLAILLLSLTLAGCASETRDPYNSPDSQRDRSGQAQDEMRKDTSRY